MKGSAMPNRETRFAWFFPSLLEEKYSREYVATNKSLRIAKSCWNNIKGKISSSVAFFCTYIHIEVLIQTMNFHLRKYLQTEND
jgi:hypothetical protein